MKRISHFLSPCRISSNPKILAYGSLCQPREKDREAVFPVCSPSRNHWSAKCQFRLKIPHCTGRKFPTPNLHRRASWASDGVEPSAVFWRVLGVTESEAQERAEASAPSCPRGGTRPALRRSFSR